MGNSIILLKIKMNSSYPLLCRSNFVGRDLWIRLANKRIPVSDPLGRLRRRHFDHGRLEEGNLEGGSVRYLTTVSQNNDNEFVVNI